MVSQQHAAQARSADAKFVEEAIGHLRQQVQRACSGWSPEPSGDGRHLIGFSSEPFRQTIIETHGLYAETIQQYLLTMDPDHTRTLLALLEQLQGGISTGAIDGATRRAVVAYAEAVLGRPRKPIYRRPAS